MPNDTKLHCDLKESLRDGNEQQGFQSKSNKAKKCKTESGRPRRCLSAYNIFFGLERKRIMKEQAKTDIDAAMSKKNKSRVGKHANVGFANLARIVSQRWRNIDTATKLKLEDLAREDRERYELEMEEWRMSETFRHVEVTEANSRTQSSAFSDVAHSGKSPAINDPSCKNAYDRETKHEVVQYTPCCNGCLASPAKTTSQTSWGGNMKLPFKFDTIDLSSSSILCLPCSENLSDNQQRQRSVMQPEAWEFVPGFPRTNSMDFACKSTESSQPHSLVSVSVDGLGSGDFSTPSEITWMPCIPSTSTYSDPTLPMDVNHHNTPSNINLVDLLLMDDVLRGLYESRMRRRASV